MWQLYVYSFFAGVFGANGLPHFLKGVMGRKYWTPFGAPSSAAVNVVWGWLNFVVAAMLLYWGHVHQHLLRAFVCVAVGSLVLGLLLAYVWTKNPQIKTSK